MDRTLTPNELQSLLDAGTSLTLLDVRRAAARDQDPVGAVESRK